MTPRHLLLPLLLLPACAAGRAVWVESVPAGAAIVVDGLQQGTRTPARVDAGQGHRRLTLRLGEAAISATLGAVGPGSREPILLSASDGSVWIERDGEARRTLRGYFPTAEAWFLVANTRSLLVDGASCDDAGIWRVPPGPHRLHGAFGEAALNGDPGFVVRLQLEAMDQPSALTARLDEESLTGELRAPGAAGLALVPGRDVTLRGTDVDVVAESRDGRRATLRFRLDPRVRTAVHVTIAASARAPRRLS
jgi:hypothetical protein